MQIKNDWVKKGVIFNPTNLSDWIFSHAYIPTPILFDDEMIRIFVAFRDAQGIGRVGYVDVSAQDPTQIISVSEKPCLDIGLPGTFDDNGVTPISIVNDNGKLHLYYVGWQLSDKVRYFLFAGLATSTDMGRSFTRVKNVPILDRTDKEFLVRTAPSVFKRNNTWHMVYSGGGTNAIIDNKLVPCYSLKYLESRDGISWSMQSQEVLTPDVKSEYGFGRPCLHYEDHIYKMWYSIRRFDKKYTIGYAESEDLKKWTRLDHQLDLFTYVLESYEDEMQAFAAVIKTNYGNYIFYNGNDFGKTGICFAVQNSVY